MTSSEYLLMYECLILQATLFIKIPDGQALVYELEGKANRPEALKSLYLEVHCKTLHKEVFPVNNWSRSKQLFKVFTEDITINSEDILYEISGHASLEVMGNNTKNYEWYFYPYKEGSVEVRVCLFDYFVAVNKLQPINTACNADSFI